jgi:hypothetical protein
LQKKRNFDLYSDISTFKFTSEKKLKPFVGIALSLSHDKCLTKKKFVAQKLDWYNDNFSFFFLNHLLCWFDKFLVFTVFIGGRPCTVSCCYCACARSTPCCSRVQWKLEDRSFDNDEATPLPRQRCTQAENKGGGF